MVIAQRYKSVESFAERRTNIDEWKVEGISVVVLELRGAAVTECVESITTSNMRGKLKLRSDFMIVNRMLCLYKTKESARDNEEERGEQEIMLKRIHLVLL